MNAVVIIVLTSILGIVALENVWSQASRSTSEGLVVLHKMQDALGGAQPIAAIRDFEETIRAEAWDANGAPLGEVRKRTRWMKSPNVVRLDQRGPRGTYVLYFDASAGAGWEILPDLRGPDPFKTTGTAVAIAGGELEFAKGCLSGFELNLWLADRIPGYAVTFAGPLVVRIANGKNATDVTLDPVTNLPLKSAGVSLADPDHPVPAEMRYEGWKQISGVRFPTRRMNFHSGVKRGEVTTEDIRVNAGLRQQDLAAKPTGVAPDLSRR